MEKWYPYHYNGLDYYKFSIFRFGKNVQTVYVFRIGNVLIDTAQSKSRHNLAAALEGADIGTLLLTHHHEDHAGNAAWVSRKFNARIYAHRLCADIMAKGPFVSPLGRLMSGNVRPAAVSPIADGEFLELGSTRLRAIHTPGHTDDHMAFHEPDRGWLFPGDLYVADRIKYFESSEDIAAQIKSLKKLAALDFDVLLCSHNPKLKEGRQRIVRKLGIFEEFYGSVAEMHYKGMSERDIFRATGRKENFYYKILTAGHFTALNMVRSVIRAEVRKTAGEGLPGD